MKLKYIITISFCLSTFLFAQYNGGSGSGYGAASSNVVGVSAFLQGPFSGGVMTTALNTNNFIQLAQPYNAAPWNYTGTESVAAGFFSTHTNIVDWVLVELRKTTAASSVDARRACFILSDGSIVDLDGTSPVKFGETDGNSYYVIIRHRNHLAVMSANALTLSSSLDGSSYLTGGISSYSFSGSQTQAFGTNPMLDLGGGVFGFISGDANASGDFSATDLAQVRIGIRDGESGYISKDLNLSGDMSSTDLLRVRQGIINGYSTQVP